MPSKGLGWASGPVVRLQGLGSMLTLDEMWGQHIPPPGLVATAILVPDSVPSDPSPRSSERPGHEAHTSKGQAWGGWGRKVLEVLLHRPGRPAALTGLEPEAISPEGHLSSSCPWSSRDSECPPHFLSSLSRLAKPIPGGPGLSAQGWGPASSRVSPGVRQPPRPSHPPPLLPLFGWSHLVSSVPASSGSPCPGLSPPRLPELNLTASCQRAVL